MSAFLSGVLKITLITDLTIGLVWLLSLCLRGGSGYRWRKMVWLFLGLRLLIPATISFAEISGQLPLIRVELNGPVNNRQVDSAAAIANGLKEQEEAGAVPDSGEGAGSPQDSMAAGEEADPEIPAAAEKGERLKADLETGLPESGMFKSRLPLSAFGWQAFWRRPDSISPSICIPENVFWKRLVPAGIKRQSALQRSFSGNMVSTGHSPC